MLIKSTCFLLLILAGVAPAAAQGGLPRWPVKDINPGANASAPDYLVNLGGVLYFAANDGVHGAELWRSDGTAAGTYMVKDIGPGGFGSEPRDLVAMNGVLYFSASTGAAGRELWRSNGAAGGTVMIKDILPGALGSNPVKMTPMNGKLFFWLDTYPEAPSTGQLWQSDGTAAGTRLVKDIDHSRYDLFNGDGTLYFCGYDPSHGLELWRSDGSSDGTYMLKDLAPGPENGAPRDFIMSGGWMCFVANERDVWRSDGSAAGTIMLFRRLDPYLTPLADVKGALFWGSGGPKPYRELYMRTSNGQVDQVKFIANDARVNFHHMLAFHGLLYFGLWGVDDLDGLWRSDGTDAGTFKLKGLDWTYNQSAPETMAAAWGGDLFFVANTPEYGLELWRTDGSMAGTRLAADLAPGPASSMPSDLTFCGDLLFFVADGAGQGRELWALDTALTTPVALSRFTTD